MNICFLKDILTLVMGDWSTQGVHRPVISSFPGSHEDNNDSATYPPAILTLYPIFWSNSFMSSRWSPWISMVFSFTVPPEPQVFFNFFATCFNWSGGKDKPVTSETPLPFLPFVCLWILTMESEAGKLFPDEHRHSCLPKPHAGHIFPVSVEYTRPLRAFLLISLNHCLSELFSAMMG